MADKELIWINSGEVSGDMHGAGLVRAMREKNPDLEFTGMGGDFMRSAGVDIAHSMEMINLVGITEVFSALPRLIRLLFRIRKDFKVKKPDALILIDCPDFNFLLARMAKKLGIPVYYYISPQVWAWRKGRVKFLQKKVRKILCILPFEQDFYRENGVEADFVGHPLLNQLDLETLDKIEPDPNKIAIFPGSRKKEVRALLPQFAAAALALKKIFPKLEFSLSLAPHMDKDLVTSLWPKELGAKLVPPEERHTLMRESAFILAASGTVALEAGLVGTPAIIAYRVSPVSFAIGKMVVDMDIKYISLPNLILNEPLFPELLQEDANGETIAAYAVNWLTASGVLEYKRNRLADLRNMLGSHDAPKQAAKIILDDMIS